MNVTTFSPTSRPRTCRIAHPVHCLPRRQRSRPPRTDDTSDTRQSHTRTDRHDSPAGCGTKSQPARCTPHGLTYPLPIRQAKSEIDGGAHGRRPPRGGRYTRSPREIPSTFPELPPTTLPVSERLSQRSANFARLLRQQRLRPCKHQQRSHQAQSEESNSEREGAQRMLISNLLTIGELQYGN